MRELDDRETEIEERWARLEADGELREIKLEQREKMVGDLELRLAKRETDLSQYVGQLQTQMDDRESDWWSKQLGTAVVANRQRRQERLARHQFVGEPGSEATLQGSSRKGTGFAGALCCKQKARGLLEWSRPLYRTLLSGPDGPATEVAAPSGGGEESRSVPGSHAHSGA